MHNTKAFAFYPKELQSQEASACTIMYMLITVAFKEKLIIFPTMPL